MINYRGRVRICTGTGCVAGGAFGVKDAFEAELKRYGLTEEIEIIATGCHGFCGEGPIVVVEPEEIFYHAMTPDKVHRIVDEHLLKGRPVLDYMYTPGGEEFPVPKMSEIGFFKKQRLVALRNRGLIDPENIDHYIARDGYKGLAIALAKLTPEQVIDEVLQSGLRGRGGAGFPAGKKWHYARLEKVTPKYIVCNADEGDPGAFMDRSLIESDPHCILEGMMIAGYAVGAEEGFVYVRNEYPLAVKRLNIAIRQAREYGLLGEDIFDSDFNFDIHVVRGAGAFVCGEATALVASIEGRIGEPRSRPPRLVQSGLRGRPTNLNNVETFANVPQIILRGAEWFASIGTENSKGTKIFSLVGKINNSGLVEVPMGITLKEMIFDIGGGVKKGRRFKAVQTGGPSGGCIPAELLDLPIDFESLWEAGSIMGSGGMVVMDDNTCMVDVARYFLEFTASESCGKCTPCREGTKWMLDILTKITEGVATEADLTRLEELSHVVAESSLCGLGESAPNPVLTTLKYFRDEYEAHVIEKRCPAAVCDKIISSPCKHTCPLGTDVPAYAAHIAQGNFLKAAEVIRAHNPLPNVCARVCSRPCEKKCRSGEWGDPVAVRNLKRFALDYERDHKRKPKPPKKKARYDQSVGIVGSGPAGLMAAFSLAQQGYNVTVYEKMPVAGGMLGLAVPDYRLPREILDYDLDYIKRAGVKFELNCTIGKDIGFEELQRRHDAIFVSVGAQKNKRLGVPGEDAEGVYDVLTFLRDVKTGARPNIGRRVGIVGGGDAAIDAARTAFRLGTEDVLILYRRTRNEMPADEDEIEEAVKEGIQIHYLVAPTRIIISNGKVAGVECQRMRLGDVDAGGRRKPVPIKDSEFIIELDALIPAIGQETDLSFLPSNNGIKVTDWNTIKVEKAILRTGDAAVFAGGDVVTGPATVIEAMGAGKVAAEAIHKYLRGLPVTREYKITRPDFEVAAVELSDEELDAIPENKPEMQKIPVEGRRGGFVEVELGLKREDAICEGKRCLRCDLSHT
jgi:NADH-quinone oxidoreductase subunit F